MGQFLICIYFLKKILEELHPSLRDIPDGGNLVKSYSGISVVKFADSISFEQSEMTLLSGKYSACWCIPHDQLPHHRIFKSRKNKKTLISIYFFFIYVFPHVTMDLFPLKFTIAMMTPFEQWPNWAQTWSEVTDCYHSKTVMPWLILMTFNVICSRSPVIYILFQMYFILLKKEISAKVYIKK